MNLGVMNTDIQDQIYKLFSSILVEQQKFDSIKTANPDKRHLTESILNEFTGLRGNKFIYNYLSSGRGHGPLTELIDESVKYDLIESMGINLLGHSHPLYIKSHLEMSTMDSVMCGNLLPYPQAFETTKAILQTVENSNLDHFWFAGSGSMANDIALKIIWQKTAPKYKIIALEKAFAGRSVATQNITFNPAYSDKMPAAIEVAYAKNYDFDNPDGAIQRTLDSLEEIWKSDSESLCAICIELIQGEAGFIHGTRDYYEKIFKWAREKDLFIWIDEIQSFGRTHQLFAFQMFGLDDYVDVVTIGKALQTCGTLFTNKLNPAPGLLGGTFNGSLVSIDMAKKIIKYLTEGNFYGEHGRIKEIESIFKSRLSHLAKTSGTDKIKKICGIGVMISFEVGDSSRKATANFLQELFTNGVIAFSAGANPTKVRFLLPLSITDEHIDEIFTILEKTVNQIFK